jgi:hypothetical protein
MQCPVCGYEEKGDSVCSRCHSSLPVKTKKPETGPSLPTVPAKPSTSPPPEQIPKEKYRRRPLMDLDLTIPELETDEERQAKLKESSEKNKKAEK